MDILDTLQRFHMFTDELNGRYTHEAIAEALGIKERTYFRYRHNYARVLRSLGLGDFEDEIEVGEVEEEIKLDDSFITPKVIYMLAQLMGMTCQEVANALGYEYLYSKTPLPHKESVVRKTRDLFPLVSRRANLYEIQNIAEDVLKVRAEYSLGNNLVSSKLGYQQAINKVPTSEPLLALYIRLLLAGVLRMTGNLTDADKEVNLIEEKAQELVSLYSGKSHLSPQLPIAKMLVVRAQACRVTIQESRGNFNQVFAASPKILDSLIELEDWAFIPYTYFNLGRTYNNVGDQKQARENAIKGLRSAHQLAPPYFSSTVLFLDHPPEYGYRWRVDHLLQLMTDVHIASGDLQSAELAYLSIPLPKSPSTTWNIHYWFSSVWQNYLSHRDRLWIGRGNMDTNITASCESWCREIEEYGNYHVAAIMRYHYAQTLRSRHQLDEAVIRLEEAMELAEKKAGAMFTAAMSGIEYIRTLAERKKPGDKELALQTLNMIYEKVEMLRIEYLEKEYSKAREVAMAMR